MMLQILRKIPQYNYPIFQRKRFQYLGVGHHFHFQKLPDPVLQQVEHFNNPGITQNDGFKPVVRYFDRITRPEQIISSLQQAIQIMLDPAASPSLLLVSLSLIFVYLINKQVDLNNNS